MIKVIEEFFQTNDPIGFKTKINNGFIYNEFSLQFEFAFYLRENGLNVYFEKNVGNLFPNSLNFINSDNWQQNSKKEIDLMVEKNIYIELKFHTINHGKFPETMYDILKDIDLLNRIKQHNKESKCYQISITESKLLFDGDNNGENESSRIIYDMFRNTRRILKNKYYKPTGKEAGEKYIDLSSLTNELKLNIQSIGNLKYCIIEI